MPGTEQPHKVFFEGGKKEKKNSTLDYFPGAILLRVQPISLKEGIGVMEVTHSESNLIVTMCLEASQSDLFSPRNLNIEGIILVKCLRSYKDKLSAFVPLGPV